MKNKHFIYTASFVAASLAAAHAQTTIAGWDFDAGGIVAPPDNSVSAITGSGTGTELGMTTSYTFAGGEGPGSVANCDIESLAGASTGSGSLAWRVRGNSNTANSGAGEANGWNSAAPIASQGAVFTPTDGTLGYDDITVTADVNVTSKGERNLAIEYTTDYTGASTIWELATITSAGSNGGVIENGSSTDTDTIDGNYIELASTGTGWNNQITATIGADADNDANFAVEFVNASTGTDCVGANGSAYNNSSGNWAFDNVVISASPVPEPATVALAGLGGLMTLITLRKSRKV